MGVLEGADCGFGAALTFAGGPFAAGLLFNLDLGLALFFGSGGVWFPGGAFTGVFALVAFGGDSTFGTVHRTVMVAPSLDMAVSPGTLSNLSARASEIFGGGGLPLSLVLSGAGAFG